jgi:hypothetical protein
MDQPLLLVETIPPRRQTTGAIATALLIAAPFCQENQSLTKAASAARLRASSFALNEVPIAGNNRPAANFATRQLENE